MRTFLDFLLAAAGWQDEKGNTVVFFETDLLGRKRDGEIWLFLDEGLRCGGMNRPLAPEPKAVREALLGVGKTALWEAIAADWKKEE